jgi:glyoxylase-like metal-dependent hydrolase (beta-lactamase superfamily II)
MLDGGSGPRPKSAAPYSAAGIREYGRGDIGRSVTAVLGWKGSALKIAPGIHRIGDNSMINSYLVEHAGEVTIIDAGVPGYYKDVAGELTAMGRTPGDVRALILTHGHTDHIGFAERLRRVGRVPVLVHEADAALARGEVPNPAKGYGRVRLGPLVGFLWFTLMRGGLRTPRLHEVATFGDGATLDVPGTPQVILTPGHTPGSAALHVPSLGALFAGDAFATYSVTTGVRGPQVAPFTADVAQAVASLTRLEEIAADVVLPGHGDPWTGGMREAIRRIRHTETTGR